MLLKLLTVKITTHNGCVQYIYIYIYIYILHNRHIILHLIPTNYTNGNKNMVYHFAVCYCTCFGIQPSSQRIQSLEKLHVGEDTHCLQVAVCMWVLDITINNCKTIN